MDYNIQIIYHYATTTDTGSSSVTIGYYEMPFLLLLFVSIVIFITLYFCLNYFIKN